MRTFRLLTLILSFSAFGLLPGCPSHDGSGAEGDPCHDDDECNDGLHCHIETGEDEGVCEADEEA